MVIIIDNYDSFTHNLALYFQELKQQVAIVKNDALTIPELCKLKAEYIVISPGPCTPNESGISMDVIKGFGGKIPILGVCLGHQAIAQCFGAKIVNAKKIMHGKVSKIRHSDSPVLFRECDSQFNVTRYHSLIIDSESLHNEFDVTAWTVENNQPVIMAIESQIKRLYGVQFHPESLLTENGHLILQNFLRYG